MSNTKSLHSSREYLTFSEDHAFTVIKYLEVLLLLCHILHLSQHSCKKWRANPVFRSQFQVCWLWWTNNSSQSASELPVISKLDYIPHAEIVYNNRLALLAHCSKTSLNLHHHSQMQWLHLESLLSQYCDHSSLSFYHSSCYAIQVFLPKLPHLCRT